MQLVLHFPLTEDLIGSFSSALAGDLVAYRNHVCRVLNYYLALTEQSSPPTAILIASAFHDLGIWTGSTLDYLPPSVALAKSYLSNHDLGALESEVCAVMTEHHKLLPYKGQFSPSVESFRRADLIDVSLGGIRFGLPSSFVQSVRAAFPNAGFHRLLARLTARQFLRSPFRPLPMVHW